jgi:hypothetical protein
MTGGNTPAWLVARSALDHHDTVAALAGALGEAIEDPDGDLAPRIASRQAAALARLGLVLIPLNPGEALTADLMEAVDFKLTEDAATGWFARQEDE